MVYNNRIFSVVGQALQGLGGHGEIGARPRVQVGFLFAPHWPAAASLYILPTMVAKVQRGQEETLKAS